MRNKRWWPVLGLTAVTLALAGCGGSSTSDANVRVANATLTHASINLLVNGSVAASGEALDTVSGYSTPGAGSVAVQINDATTGAVLSASSPTLSGGGHYTVVAYESGGVVNTAVLTEDTAVPSSGVTLRFYNAAPQAGKLDIYQVSGTSTCTGLTGSPNLSFPLASTATALFGSAATGSYTICVTGGGNKNDLRLVLPVTYTNQTVATVVLTPAAGGALLNGALVVQQGAYTAARNTNTRVRLAASITGGGVVAASSNGSGNTSVTIDGGSASPLLDFSYVVVPSTQGVNITVNSASIASPVADFTSYVGQDVTLYVSGTTAAPVASLITDTNLIPTDLTTANVRLINGLPSGVGNLTLTANNTPVGVSVASATAGPYTVLPGSSSNSSFVVSFAATSAASGSLPLDTSSVSQTLNVGSTYTILAAPDATTGLVELLIR